MRYGRKMKQAIKDSKGSPPVRNDLLPRPGLEKKNRRRFKMGKPLIPNMPKESPGQGGAAPKKRGKKPPFDLTAPLRGKGLKREIKASTRLEFGPLERQLASEFLASKGRQDTEIPHYFGAYQNDLARLTSGVQGAYDSATNRVQDFSNQGGQQDATNRAAIMARLQHDAQVRGGTVDPNVDVGQAGAEAARRNLQTSILATLAGQGANAFRYLSDKQGIAGQAMLEAQAGEAARRGKITADQRELAQKKGDYRTDLRRELRKDERAYLLEKKATGVKSGYNKAITKVAKLGLQGKKVSAQGGLAVAQQQGTNEQIKGKQYPKLPGGSQSGKPKKKRPALGKK